MPSIRVSGIQMEVSPKLDVNLEKILRHIAHGDCNFMIFPEMSLTGYHGDFNDRAVRDAWRLIATACRQSYVTAIIGTGAKEDGATFIQSRIYSDEGKLVGTHEKLVPTTGDRRFCRPGEELRVYQHLDITFGCLICNDMWVTPGCGPYPDPRLSYQLGQRGAQVIFHSINSGTSDIHASYHESNLRLRAMEANTFIVTANAADKTASINAPTGVVGPDGKWLTRCDPSGERSFVIDLDIDT